MANSYKELQAQHADEERLGEREMQLEAFAAALYAELPPVVVLVRMGLVQLTMPLR